MVYTSKYIYFVYFLCRNIFVTTCNRSQKKDECPPDFFQLYLYLLGKIIFQFHLMQKHVPEIRIPQSTMTVKMIVLFYLHLLSSSALELNKMPFILD